jgi:pimeloyl-ACP methyl ester carboxylesterase
VQHLRDNGYDARLLQPPAWRGVEHDLERYGRNLATDIDRDGVSVDVLIGLSAGTQAAAVAASLTDLVERVVLVSPTIDPAYRSMIKQSMVFVRGDPHDKAAFFSQDPFINPWILPSARIQRSDLLRRDLSLPKEACDPSCGSTSPGGS